jgi:hypothetical protein
MIEITHEETGIGRLWTKEEMHIEALWTDFDVSLDHDSEEETEKARTRFVDAVSIWADDHEMIWDDAFEFLAGKLDLRYR